MPAIFIKTLKKIAFVFIVFFLHNVSYAQSIDLERALALFYAGDYETCIQEVKSLQSSSQSYHTENFDYILYIGMQCCQAYKSQLQNQIDLRQQEQSRFIIQKMQELWETSISFIQRLDVICRSHLETAHDLKTKYHYLLLMIDYNQIIASETDDNYFEKEVNSLYKKFSKEIFPNLNNGEFSPEEIMTGYSRMLLYYANNNNEKKLLDCMFNVIEPWINNSVILNNDLDKHTKLVIFDEYLGTVKMMNVLLEYKEDSENYYSQIINLNIRAKNISYYLNGNEQYKNHINERWTEIQKTLKEGELAIEFFNAVSSDQHLFALIFDNKCKSPKLEYCGHSYWVEKDVFGFNHLLERNGIKEYSNIYFSTTNEMAFIDMGQYKRAHRLHSLSELLMPRVESVTDPTVYSFADINFSLGDSIIYDNQYKTKGAITTEKLRGAKNELDFTRAIISPDRLHIYDKDNATKVAFLSLTNLKFDILHVSSHGYFDLENSKIESTSNLLSSMEGSSILKNCGLKLSGYNDDSETGQITAAEIAKLNLSNVGLVILSACETGTGASRLGNIYSLAEAFHSAGVRNIIATTTEIDDYDAFIFYKTFMTEVTKGCSFHDSFVSAQQATTEPQNYIFWE